MLTSVGGWPVLEGDKWDEAQFTWKDSVYKFRTAGYSVDYFIDFSISTDLKNTTTRAIDVSYAGPPLRTVCADRAQRTSDSAVDDLYRFGVEIF